MTHVHFREPNLIFSPIPPHTSKWDKSMKKKKNSAQVTTLMETFACNREWKKKTNFIPETPVGGPSGMGIGEGGTGTEMNEEEEGSCASSNNNSNNWLMKENKMTALGS